MATRLGVGDDDALLVRACSTSTDGPDHGTAGLHRKKSSDLRGRPLLQRPVSYACITCPRDGFSVWPALAVMSDRLSVQLRAAVRQANTGVSRDCRSIIHPIGRAVNRRPGGFRTPPREVRRLGSGGGADGDWRHEAGPCAGTGGMRARASRRPSHGRGGRARRLGRRVQDEDRLPDRLQPLLLRVDAAAPAAGDRGRSASDRGGDCRVARGDDGMIRAGESSRVRARTPRPAACMSRTVLAYALPLSLL